MKLEHVSDANVGGSGDDLIRLVEFTPAEVKSLAEEIRSVLLAQKKSVQLDGLDFIRSLNCQLTLVLSDKSVGIHKNASGTFTCGLTYQGYLRMVELMEPFMNDSGTGFQWLYDLPTEDNRTEFLISSNGKW